MKKKGFSSNLFWRDYRGLCPHLWLGVLPFERPILQFYSSVLVFTDTCYKTWIGSMAGGRSLMLPEIIPFFWEHFTLSGFEESESASQDEIVATCTSTRAAASQFSSVFTRAIVPGRCHACTTHPVHLGQNTFYLSLSMFSGLWNLLSRTVSPKRILSQFPFHLLHRLVRLHLNEWSNSVLPFCQNHREVAYIRVGRHPNRLSVLLICWSLQQHRE